MSLFNDAFATVDQLSILQMVWPMVLIIILPFGLRQEAQFLRDWPLGYVAVSGFAALLMSVFVAVRVVSMVFWFAFGWNKPFAALPLPLPFALATAALILGYAWLASLPLIRLAFGLGIRGEER